MRKDKLTKLKRERTKLFAEMAWMFMQNANNTSDTAELESAAKKSEISAKRAKTVRDAEYSLNAPSTAAYSALLIDRD